MRRCGPVLGACVDGCYAAMRDRGELRTETKPKMKYAAPGVEYRRAAVKKVRSQCLVGGQEQREQWAGQAIVRVESVTCAALETRNTTGHVIGLAADCLT